MVVIWAILHRLFGIPPVSPVCPDALPPKYLRMIITVRKTESTNKREKFYLTTLTSSCISTSTEKSRTEKGR